MKRALFAALGALVLMWSGSLFAQDTQRAMGQAGSDRGEMIKVGMMEQGGHSGMMGQQGSMGAQGMGAQSMENQMKLHREQAESTLNAVKRLAQIQERTIQGLTPTEKKAALSELRQIESNLDRQITALDNMSAGMSSGTNPGMSSGMNPE